MSSGVHDGLSELSTEGRNPASANIDCLSPLEIVRIMNDEDARVATAIEAELPQIAAAIEQIAERMGTRGGRLIYLGAGTSGRLGVIDASECPPTFSTPPGLVVGWIAGGPQALTDAVEELEDSADAGRADIERLGITAADVVVGITASGRTPYVLGAIGAANERGAMTIGLACNANSDLARLVKIMIAPLVGPEVIAGSTRLKAGTAQKMVLNMLSTGTMIRLGKTFGNLMVDLRATNSKLRQRAIRIVQEATGLDPSQAADLLRRSGDEAKTAIVSARAGILPDEARSRLTQSRGSVRAALGEAAPCPK
ncbi:MAG TPA: N-acetylmuramic acid 6-phosphate etherase [Thermomicrobiales bacterium]|nr:N-acetylmuramic acid 6-phosphate etherase [Thermomicrobiales bacterium]